MSGDVNGDGTFNLADVAQTLRLAAGLDVAAPWQISRLGAGPSILSAVALARRAG